MIKRVLLFTLGLILSGPSSVFAAPALGNISNPYTGSYNTTGGLGAFIGNLVGAATTVAGLGFLIYLILGAFRYLTAGGDEKAIAEARKTIMYALIGLGIVVMALAITWAIGTVLGVDILHPQFRGP